MVCGVKLTLFNGHEWCAIILSAERKNCQTAVPVKLEIRGNATTNCEGIDVDESYYKPNLRASIT